MRTYSHLTPFSKRIVSRQRCAIVAWLRHRNLYSSQSHDMTGIYGLLSSSSNWHWPWYLKVHIFFICDSHLLWGMWQESLEPLETLIADATTKSRSPIQWEQKQAYDSLGPWNKQLALTAPGIQVQSQDMRSRWASSPPSPSSLRIYQSGMNSMSVTQNPLKYPWLSHQ